MMKHDRMQPTVDFQMCVRGFLLRVGGQYGDLGALYAFDRIEDVAAWFVDQYAQSDTHPQGGDGEAAPFMGSGVGATSADAPKEGSDNG